MKHLLQLLVLGSAIGFGLLAQGTGTIHGTVTDASGLAVPGATVIATLESRGTQRNVTTDSRGDYVLPLLPVGTYAIQAEVKGFKTFRQQGITVNATDNVRVDAQLEVGSVSESVSVTAEAPLVDSRSSTVGTLIDPRRVLDLPINGRNVIALAGLLPGVSQVSAPQTFTGDRSGPTVSVSGSRTTQNLFLFDGAPFNATFRNTGLNYPPPDALQEVKVLTNSFSAEYGRNAGSIFNVVTRSGTNEVHGSAWEFLRNHKLNARNFFAGSVKPQLIQNQFGAAAGGPIIRNRLFIFGSYEGLRVRPAALETSAFPLTSAERSGNFAGTAAARDPLTGQPFPGNQVPVLRFDPVVNNIFSKNLMPLPNRSDGQLVDTSATPEDNSSWLVRADYSRGRHTAEARYHYSAANAHDYAGSVPSYLPLAREAINHSATIGDTFTVTPSLLNQVRVSFTRMTPNILNLNPLHLSDLGGAFPMIGSAKIPPFLDISGRLSLGNASNVDTQQVNQNFSLSDNINWTRSGHTVKGGFELLKLRYANRSYWQTMGSFTFNGQITGNPAVDFVLGRPQNMVVASPLLQQDGKQTNTYFYFQDDWKVLPRLTLNIGLRYELPLPWVHPNDYWGTFRPGQQSQVIRTAPVGMVFPGDPGIPRGLVQTDRNNFAPRIGFAWDPFGKGRTSVRAAYGIFYDALNANVIQNNSQPFRYAFTVQTPQSLSNPFAGVAAIPLTTNLSNPQFAGVQQIVYPDPDMRTPYTQQINFNVQHQVLADLAVQVGYAGKLGRKMLIGYETNPALYRAGATSGNIDQRRIFAPFGKTAVHAANTNASYHGLQIEANKRFSRGFSFQGAYTWSRSIDLTSSISESGGVPYVFDLNTERGLSNFHAKHIGSFSVIWDLPRLESSAALLRGIAGGWQMNVLYSYRSGQPVNATSGTDVALSGTSNQRPNVVGDPKLPEGRARADRILAWFDRNAFARPDTGTYGNAGRNVLLGPARGATNLGVFKEFGLPWRERLRLQFRSEFFNVFNSVNLGNPNAALNAGARMGRITGAADPRVIQFALKALF
jgi:outer membrane receptor protein involved in Fe transport